jgi:hypothetical protein
VVTVLTELNAAITPLAKPPAITAYLGVGLFLFACVVADVARSGYGVITQRT